ncbi:hypothetical protein EXU48_23485 [Occultella glacieicola]|uniref:Uncharacterized protein n=1 Tax=Occultella glacieicola TaxID=2518684 RepID=A0ABY2E043_9MICO|nr:hypothetical protein [Occultella glacieicola]TDE88340.1 hypothetical protein EXU48_23485 [Occultella glacieicola]
MLFRPAELEAIRDGAIDLTFRRWDRARVKEGTRLRTAVGLIAVTGVEAVPLSALRTEDARRSGAASVAALRSALTERAGGRVYRIGLSFAGPDPRDGLRETVPAAEELALIVAGLDRLDAASTLGPWTRATLRLIDANPEVRAPELAATVRRPTPDFKRDVRKLKERGLTESLAIGYRLSPRGESVLDHLDGPRDRPPRRPGTPLPRSIGAPATRALRAVDVHTLEAVSHRTAADLAALHGVGPIALDRLAGALAAAGLGFADGAPTGSEQDQPH